PPPRPPSPHHRRPLPPPRPHRRRPQPRPPRPHRRSLSEPKARRNALSERSVSKRLRPAPKRLPPPKPLPKHPPHPPPRSTSTASVRRGRLSSSVWRVSAEPRGCSSPGCSRSISRQRPTCSRSASRASRISRSSRERPPEAVRRTICAPRSSRNSA
ncbi:MAG: hypothetical protein ACTIAA_06690, partial [Microbacterium sp.]